MLLGFMALGRLRRPEALRHVAPGEIGKVIGLDRSPEVRTLRQKIAIISTTGKPLEWMRELSKTWMESDPKEAGYLYVDGHVRVYHGKDAILPRRIRKLQAELGAITMNNDENDIQPIESSSTGSRSDALYRQLSIKFCAGSAGFD